MYASGQCARPPRSGLVRPVPRAHKLRGQVVRPQLAICAAEGTFDLPAQAKACNSCQVEPRPPLWPARVPLAPKLPIYIATDRHSLPCLQEL